MHNYEVSDELLNILTRMLNIDADDRPSVDDILDYEWFSKITQKLNHEDDIA
jgi:serine/threonine protein kinase